jgi:pimeloyl-ACP methyl ester carboxylesterase
MWDGVGSALAAKGHRSVAVDLRGHGRSDKPDDGYDFDTVTRDLCELLDALAIDTAIFVGQSWGGNIVVHAAHQHPDRVIAAVPVDGGFIQLGDSFPDWEVCAERMHHRVSPECAPVDLRALFVPLILIGPNRELLDRFLILNFMRTEQLARGSPLIVTC